MAPQPCGTCNGLCDKAYVAVGETHYHTECFKCLTCAKALAGQPHIPHGKSIYCEACYHDAHSPKCGHCDEIITGNHVEALGKMWHPEHFLCSDCGADFPDDKFHKIDSRPYCKVCYAIKTAECCAKCGLDIVGEDMFEAHEKKYHKACFVCATGNHAIADGEEFHVYNDSIYCTHHLGELLELNCSECSKLIPGEYIMVHDKKMHTQCWKCADCKCVLAAGNARAHEGKFLCNKCFSAAGGTVIGGASEGAVGDRFGNMSLDDGARGSRSFIGGGATEILPPGVGAYFTYDRLKDKKAADLPPGVNMRTREQYLADDEFFKVFGMDKAAFAKLPKWRQKQKKQAAKLW